ncbi:MAG TPA: GGDEF domain-containing protein [Xanthomonadaceae bacterium]
MGLNSLGWSMQGMLRAKILVIILAIIPGMASAFDEDFSRKLAEADQLRSSNPKQFSELLKTLDSQQGRATEHEIQRLRYLQAFHAAVYQDKVSEGVTHAIDLYKNIKDPELKFRTGSLIANLSAINRDFRTGFRYLGRTLDTRKSVSNKSIRHDGVGAAAALYNEVGQHSLGLKYANEILAESPAPRTKCFATSIKLEAQRVLGKLPQGKDVFSAEIEACRKINELMAASTLRATLARKWAKEGKLDSAVALLAEALGEVEQTRYPWLIAEVRSILAELELQRGNPDAAKAHADAAVSYGKQIASSAALVSAYRTLYEVASSREKSTAALDLYKRYAESQMAHQSDVKARELAYEIVRHETQQKNKEIELLQAQQRLERENTQKAQLTTLFLAILLAGAVFWAFQVKRHQHQLKKLAQTDSLTGLGNRHYFTQKSERALVEAARAGEPASLVMFDLDHFKAINDTYGHGAGDWVLKQVGKTCSSHCRKIDYIGRIGGEEFAVLLRGIDLAAAERLAENCRAQLAQIDTRDCGYSFVVTGSFGVSSTAQSGYDLSRLLSHADQMLYRAKNEGRNRVCAYTAEAASDYRSMRRAPSLSVVNR